MMRKILKTFVKILHTLSFVGVIIVGLFGAVYEVVGHAKFEKVMSAIGICNGFAVLWMVGVTMLVLLIVTHFFVKEK